MGAMFKACPATACLLLAALAPVAGVGAAEPARWEFVVLAAAPQDGLTVPALQHHRQSGVWQVAFSRSGPEAGIDWLAPAFVPGVHLLDIGGRDRLIAADGDPSPCRPGVPLRFAGSPLGGQNPAVSLSDGMVAFRAEGAPSPQPAPVFHGVYVGDGLRAPRCVADLLTPIPASGGRTFQTLFAPSLSGGHVVFSGGANDWDGVYGDFGAGLAVVADRATPLVLAGTGAVFEGFGSYPSVSGTYFLDDADQVAFYATARTTAGALVEGIYASTVGPAGAQALRTIADSNGYFPARVTRLNSPAADFAGDVAFRASVDAAGASVPSGVYGGGRALVAPLATVGMTAPAGDDAVFHAFAAYPASDAQPHVVGQESVEHWQAFVADPASATQALYLRHARLGQAATVEQVIDNAGLLRLLAPRRQFAPDGPLQPPELSLFHQGVSDGAIVFKAGFTGGPAPFGHGADFIILARKTEPTLWLAPDADTYVRADLVSRRNDNYGLQEFIEVGTGQADDDQPEGAADRMRALLHFDLSMLPPLELSGAALEASLLSYDQGGPLAVYTVEAHALLAPWSGAGGEGNGYEGVPPPHAAAGLTDPDSASGVAWAGNGRNSDPAAANNRSQPPLDPAVLDTQLLRQGTDLPGTRWHWDVTALARAWLARSAPLANNGLALSDATGDLFRGVRFGSREGERYGLPGAVAGPRLALKWSVGIVPGDLSGDNCVDRADLAVLLAVLRGQAMAGPGLAAVLDLNGDGKVDIADARKLATLFSQPLGAPCPAP